MNAQVRTAVPHDAGQIARIHSASWRVTYDEVLPSAYLRSLEPSALARRWQLYLTGNRVEQVVVAELGARLAGFATSGPTRGDDDPGFAGELYMIYVDPDFEGTGVGSRLIASATESLIARRFMWMVVWVVAVNERARDFYRSVGFRDDGASRTDGIGGGQVDVVRMAKPIGPVVRFEPR